MIKMTEDLRAVKIYKKYKRYIKRKDIKDIYYIMERKEVNPDGSYYWLPLQDTISSEPINCEGKTTWRCVRVTTIYEILKN